MRRMCAGGYKTFPYVVPDSSPVVPERTERVTLNRYQAVACPK